MSGALATASAASQAVANTRSSPSATMAGDFNTFLTMLTTQLQNQDPTSPLDTNQMTSQLVQFASVEQLIAMNQNLDRILSVEQASQLTAAAPLIGRTVEVESDHLTLQGGSAAIRLPAAGTAAAARVLVTDSSGRTVKDSTVRLGSGTTTWTWDGRDSTGRQMADGSYRVAVAGISSTGSSVAAPFTVLGRATAADQTNGTLNLHLGALSVGFSSLRGLAD